jgi:cell wall-associated NlpC family hydrolase
VFGDRSTAAEQSRVGSAVADAALLLPGDLLFVPGSDGTVADPGHVGMYVGDGLVLDAPHEGQVVHVSRIGVYWLTDLAIRRVVSR